MKRRNTTEPEQYRTIGLNGKRERKSALDSTMPDSTIRTPMEAQCITCPAFDKSLLHLPIYVQHRMSWADQTTALGLAVLEAMRRLLGNESSQLLMLSDLARQTQTLLDYDGCAKAVDSTLIASIISAWRIFPISTHAIEATPRRIAAVIEQYRELGRLQARTSRFLSVLGTTDFIDKITDPPDEW